MCTCWAMGVLRAIVPMGWMRGGGAGLQGGTLGSHPEPTPGDRVTSTLHRIGLRLALAALGLLPCVAAMATIPPPPPEEQTIASAAGDARVTIVPGSMDNLIPPPPPEPGTSTPVADASPPRTASARLERK